jgi:hypothetical protein
MNEEKNKQTDEEQDLMEGAEAEEESPPAPRPSAPENPLETELAPPEAGITEEIDEDSEQPSIFEYSSGEEEEDDLGDTFDEPGGEEIEYSEEQSLLETTDDEVVLDEGLPVEEIEPPAPPLGELSPDEEKDLDDFFELDELDEKKDFHTSVVPKTEEAPEQETDLDNISTEEE